jgi:hypothetical protein
LEDTELEIIYVGGKQTKTTKGTSRVPTSIIKSTKTLPINPYFCFSEMAVKEDVSVVLKQV